MSLLTKLSLCTRKLSSLSTGNSRSFFVLQNLARKEKLNSLGSMAVSPKFFSSLSEFLDSSLDKAEPMKKIVVGLGENNLAASKIALEAVCGLVSTWNPTITSKLCIQALNIPKSNDVPSDIIEMFQSVVKKYLNLTTQLTIATPNGTIKSALVTHAHDISPDLFVIGGGGTHFLRLTSFVEFVIRQTPCDVLIVRENDNATRGILPSRDDPRPMKVVVCIGLLDLTGGLEALRSAMRLCRDGDTIYLVTAYHSSGIANSLHPAELPSAEGTKSEIIEGCGETNETDDGAALLSDLEDILRKFQNLPENVDRKIDMKPIILPDETKAPTAVCEFAAREGVDLICTGYGGSTHSFLLSSFSYQISHNSPCCALIARKRSDKDDTEAKD